MLKSTLTIQNGSFNYNMYNFAMLKCIIMQHLTPLVENFYKKKQLIQLLFLLFPVYNRAAHQAPILSPRNYTISPIFSFVK